MSVFWFGSITVCSFFDLKRFFLRAVAACPGSVKQQKNISEAMSSGGPLAAHMREKTRKFTCANNDTYCRLFSCIFAAERAQTGCPGLQISPENCYFQQIYTEQYIYLLPY